MNRTKYLALLLTPFLSFSILNAQIDEAIIIPSDYFADDIFAEEAPLEEENFEEEAPTIFLEEEPIIELSNDIESEFEGLLVEPTNNEVPLIIGESNPAASTAGLPSSATKTLSVVNISQNNQDALASGARAGDILRYQYVIDSQSEDVKNYVAQVDLSGLTNAVNFTDVGLGTVSGSMLTFPAYSQAAPCNQIYTFFVQVKEDCGDLKAVNVSAGDKSIRVNLNCGLTKVGPGNPTWMWGLAIILGALGMMVLARRKV